MIHIVDDEEAVRDFLSSAVELIGVDVRSYTSAGSYLELMSSPDYLPPRILVCDINMPEMIGCVLVEKIKEISPQTLIFMISGNLQQCTEQCCARHRATGLIEAKMAKPFDVGEFLNLLLQAKS